MWFLVVDVSMGINFFSVWTMVYAVVNDLVPKISVLLGFIGQVS